MDALYNSTSIIIPAAFQFSCNIALVILVDSIPSKVMKLLINCLSYPFFVHAVVVGVMVVLPGVAHMDVDPTLVGGALEELGGAPVVVDGALLQGEAVDPAHEPLQVYTLIVQYMYMTLYIKFSPELHDIVA